MKVVRRSRASLRFGLVLTVYFAAGAALLLGQSQPAGQSPAHSASVSPPTSDEPLDINTATFAQLRALPGMGDVYVRRIIEGRPYSAKNQLVTKGVLPAGAYIRIRDAIVARHVLRR